MTLKELAKLANVSVSTVSRVINGNDSHAAGPEKRELIWKLVRETNYVPNKSAQSLKTGSCGISGTPHTISCIFARSAEGLQDSFFSQIFYAIEQKAVKRGCSITGVFSAFEMSRNGSFDDLIHSNPEGIILLGRYSKSLLSYLRNRFKNIIYTGLNSIQDDYDQIICDGYGAAKTAVKHLHSLGHTKIGYIGERSNEARYLGYHEGLLELKIPVNRNYIFETSQSIKGGYESGLKITKITPDPPTAIFCANDTTAIGAMKALSESNFKIPDDISIISIDNVEMCQYVTPMLTSIDIPKGDLGKFAVKTLLDRIDGGHRIPVKIEIPYKLIQRNSCAPPKAYT
ncbi:MAG TPA: LacI family transcriptional regulator [Ruminiclostridium sp.]|nr:LacI family transcriptional regulator [Ruminiclostridium sp.]